jgi:D-sedoheptulose 7-phosphate isomerase
VQQRNPVVKRRQAPDDPAAYVRVYRQATLSVLEQLSDHAVANLIQILEEARSREQHIFVCGNGGSAATASHLAAGLDHEGSRRLLPRFRVLSLTDNVPWITSLANDVNYADIFVEQLRNLARSGDVLLAFSGSGNSPNILRAIEWGNDAGLITVGITGRPGGRLAALAQHVVFVESSHIGRIEEGHFLIQHLVSYYFAEKG